MLSIVSKSFSKKGLSVFTFNISTLLRYYFFRFLIIIQINLSNFIKTS